MAEMKKAAEIVAALERCSGSDGICRGCPYQSVGACIPVLAADAAALIRSLCQEVPGCDGT